MAHTPGPWTARQCDGQILLNGSNCYEVREIFNPQGGFNPEDIRLMAAAPDLHAACKRLFQGWGDVLEEMDEVAFSDLRMALMKAEGET